VLKGAGAVAGAFLSLSGLAAAPAASCDATIDHVPVVVSAPGTYCLASDLQYDGDGVAVLVAASSVVVDLQGFTLSGTAGPGSGSVGIDSMGATNVTVRNGVVSGFRSAVLLEDGGFHLVSGVTATSNWYIGIAVAGPASAIQGCQVLSTGGSLQPDDTIPFGLASIGDGVVISDNLVKDVVPPPGGEAIGINLEPGSQPSVRRNVIANAALVDSTWGIWTLATDDDIADNLFIRYSYGIAFAAPSTGAYSGNTFFNVPNPVALGGPSVVDLGNSVVHAFCEPIYALPWVISAEGTYCLVRNLSTAIASGDAITVAASDVRLDLRGFKIGGGTAGPATQAIGIHAVDQRNVSVLNGNVRGFASGVVLEDTSADLSGGGHRVERILADENTTQGIHVQGRGALVRRNQVVGTTGTGGGGTADSFGIRVEGALAHVIDNEVSGTVSGGTAYAVAVSSGRGSVVDHNRVSGAAGGASVGILFRSSPDATAAANRILGTLAGLWFAGSSGTYRDNVTAGVATPYVGGTDAGHNN